MTVEDFPLLVLLAIVVLGGLFAGIERIGK